MPLSSFFSSLSCVSENSSRRHRAISQKKSQAAAPLSASAPSEETHEAENENRKRATPISSYVNDHGEVDSFWDIGKFKVALKRCDNGQKLGSDLMDLISERAKLEDNYGKAIKSWSHKWTEQLNSNAEYETTKDAWVIRL